MSRVLAVPDVHGNKIVLENAKAAYEKAQKKNKSDKER